MGILIFVLAVARSDWWPWVQPRVDRILRGADPVRLIWDVFCCAAVVAILISLRRILGTNRVLRRFAEARGMTYVAATLKSAFQASVVGDIDGCHVRVGFIAVPTRHLEWDMTNGPDGTWSNRSDVSIHLEVTLDLPTEVPIQRAVRRDWYSGSTGDPAIRVVDSGEVTFLVRDPEGVYDERRLAGVARIMGPVVTGSSFRTPNLQDHAIHVRQRWRKYAPLKQKEIEDLADIAEQLLRSLRQAWDADAELGASAEPRVSA